MMYRIVRRDGEPTDASDVLWKDYNEAWEALLFMDPPPKNMSWKSWHLLNAFTIAEVKDES